MASLADKKKALDWSNRNARGFQGILDVNQFLPVTGDIQSGIMAGQDLQKGNYGSAALNSLGLLPFIPALGGITAYHGTNKLFNPSEILPSTSGTYGKGVYLAQRPTTAQKYGETLLKYDIPEQNLFDVYGVKSDDYKKLYKDSGIKYNSKVDDYLRLGAATNAFQEAQKDLGDISKHGYEGVKGYSEFGGDEYLLFNPKKLKSIK